MCCVMLCTSTVVRCDALCLAAATVALPKEGPVHDVQWSPAGDYFLTVAGFMPAKVCGKQQH